MGLLTLVFMILNHCGPLFICCIFKVFSHTVSISQRSSQKNYAVSMTPRSQALRSHWHYGVRPKFSVIFVKFFYFNIKRQFHEIFYTVFHDSTSKTYFRTVLRFWRYCSAVLMLKNGTAFAVSMTPRSKKLMSSQIRSHIRKTCKKSIRDTKLGYS